MNSGQSIGGKLHTCVVVLILVPVVIVFVPVFLMWRLICGIVLRAWFYRAHRIHGRFILFVYSHSPNWQSYIEQNFLPRVESRAVVLNWSRRQTWPDEFPWESRMVFHWGGEKDFNPLALVFTGCWNVATIRFHQAFLDFKHGRPQKLRRAESELFARLPEPEMET